MAYFKDVEAALGVTAPESDLVVANARIAELESKLADLQAKDKDRADEYWKWRHRCGSSFTLSEELVCALGLQRADPKQAVVLAIENIKALQEAAAGRGQESRDIIPAVKPDVWHLSDCEGEYVNDLGESLIEWAESAEFIGKVITVSPVWYGSFRYAVVVPKLSDAPPEKQEIIGHDVKLFLAEHEANAFAATAEPVDA